MTAGLLRVFHFIFNYHRRRLSKRGEPNVATRLRRTSEEALPRRTVEQGFLPVCALIQLASPTGCRNAKEPCPLGGKGRAPGFATALHVSGRGAVETSPAGDSSMGATSITRCGVDG